MGLEWPGRGRIERRAHGDRKSTRLNSSHPSISYAVFCLKKKTHRDDQRRCRAVVPAVRADDRLRGAGVAAGVVLTRSDDVGVLAGPARGEAALDLPRAGP